MWKMPTEAKSADETRILIFDLITSNTLSTERKEILTLSFPIFYGSGTYNINVINFHKQNIHIVFIFMTESPKG